MSSKWTVAPQTRRLDNLEYGGETFWLEVKERLTKGERDRVRTSGMKAVAGIGEAKPGETREPQVVVDFAAQGVAQTLEYLVDWSLTDDKGNKLPLAPPSRKLDTINALDPDLYDFIESAISKHVQEMADLKKLQGGESKPRAISA